MKTFRLFLILIILTSVQIVNGQETIIDTNKANIKWTASKKVGGSHNGEIQLKIGVVKFEKDKIVKAHFILDMNSITNNDLKNKIYNAKLVNHLKSEDFFSVDKYPTAELMINNISNFTNDKAFVYGKITIKGITQDITFEINRNNNIYTARIEIDRSKFDVRYGSDSFFDNLGDKVINDIFIIDVSIVI